MQQAGCLPSMRTLHCCSWRQKQQQQQLWRVAELLLLLLLLARKPSGDGRFAAAVARLFQPVSVSRSSAAPVTSKGAALLAPSPTAPLPASTAAAAAAAVGRGSSSITGARLRPEIHAALVTWQTAAAGRSRHRGRPAWQQPDGQ